LTFNPKNFLILYNESFDYKWPNLNLLGTREPEIYGNVSMETYLENLKSEFQTHELNYYQSNIEENLSTGFRKMILMQW
jgi:3-dehydroquinate dehydratase